MADADTKQIPVYFPGENTVWYNVQNYRQYNGSQIVLINVDMESVNIKLELE